MYIYTWLAKLSYSKLAMFIISSVLFHFWNIITINIFKNMFPFARFFRYEVIYSMIKNKTHVTLPTIG